MKETLFLYIVIFQTIVFFILIDKKKISKISSDIAQLKKTLPEFKRRLDNFVDISKTVEEKVSLKSYFCKWYPKICLWRKYDLSGTGLIVYLIVFFYWKLITWTNRKNKCHNKQIYRSFPDSWILTYLLSLYHIFSCFLFLVFDLKIFNFYTNMHTRVKMWC